MLINWLAQQTTRCTWASWPMPMLLATRKPSSTTPTTTFSTCTGTWSVFRTSLALQSSRRKIWTQDSRLWISILRVMITDLLSEHSLSCFNRRRSTKGSSNTFTTRTKKTKKHYKTSMITTMGLRSRKPTSSPPLNLLESVVLAMLTITTQISKRAYQALNLLLRDFLRWMKTPSKNTMSVPRELSWEDCISPSTAHITPWSQRARVMTTWSSNQCLTSLSLIPLWRKLAFASSVPVLLPTWPATWRDWFSSSLRLSAILMPLETTTSIRSSTAGTSIEEAFLWNSEKLASL